MLQRLCAAARLLEGFLSTHQIELGQKKKSQTKIRVNHRASNFLGISGIVAPPAPPAFRNVLGRAACIEKQMLPKPKQSWVLVVNGPTLRAGVISARCQHVVIGTAGLFYNPAVEPILQRSSLEGGERGRQKAALLYFLVTGGRRIINGEREGRVTSECYLSQPETATSNFQLTDCC